MKIRAQWKMEGSDWNDSSKATLVFDLDAHTLTIETVDQQDGYAPYDDMPKRRQTYQLTPVKS